MDDQNRNSTGEDKSYNREHTEAAFCEELLCCFVCGKIYFSRKPIKLPTLQRRNLHVCVACNRTLKCSVCGRPITARTALFVENLPNSGDGFLCPRCRDRVFLGFNPSPKGLHERLWSGVISACSAFVGFLRRIMSIEIWPSGKGR